MLYKIDKDISKWERSKNRKAKVFRKVLEETKEGGRIPLVEIPEYYVHVNIASVAASRFLFNLCLGQDVGILCLISTYCSCVKSVPSQ